MNFEKKSVFISYRTDSGWEIANLIQRYLSSKGISVFFDKLCIDGGQKWYEVLEENIKKCSVFVPIICGGSHNCNDNSKNNGSKENVTDYLWKEIELALSKGKVKIIPIFCDGFKEPTNLPEKYKKYWETIKEKQGKISLNKNTCQDILNNLYLDVKRYLNEDLKYDNELYSNPVGKEKQLEEALENDHFEINKTKEIDEKIFKDILDEQISGLNILDLGCGDGAKVFELLKNLTDFNNLNKYIGIDIIGSYIEKAKKLSGDNLNKYLFFQYDLRNENLKDFLESLVIEHLERGKKFNLIIISNLLYNLANPYRIIEAAKSVLSKGGTLLICDIDDSYNTYYPDTNNWIESFERLYGESNRNGNRRSGKQIYALLKKAGFPSTNNEIKFKNFVIPNTANLTYDQKKQRFEKKHKELLAEFEQKEKEEHQLFYYEAINWLTTCKEDLIQAYGNVDFSTESYIVITAENK